MNLREALIAQGPSLELHRAAQAEIARLDAIIHIKQRALEEAARLHTEALPKFNWGASCLDANAIRLLNEVPATVTRAIAF
jgi:hypothetical protein